MSAPRRHPSATRRAIVKGLTSFVVGVTIFVCLTLLRSPPLIGPFVRHVEVLGTDLGIYAESFLRFVRPPAPGQMRYHYVFFDLDRDACATLYQDDRACAPTAPADRRIVAKMVRAARDSGALVVVLDIATTWPAPSADDPLTEALARQSRTNDHLSPVVLPLLADIRLTPQERSARLTYAIRPLLTFSGPAAPLEARLYFGLPLSSSGEPDWGGDMVRAAAQALPADAMTAGSGPRAYWTLAGAAACLAKHPGEAEACRDPQVKTIPERIHFSIPSMVLSPRNDPRNAVTRWWTTRLQASVEFANDDQPFAATRLLRDAIVVIGSSRDLRDYHDTPLGQMTGAEIVLNAICSFLEFPPLGDVGLIGSILGEMPIIACTAIVFAFFWWWVSRHARRSRAQHRSWHRQLRSVALHSLGFLFTCVVALCFAFVLTFSTVLLQSASRYDVVTPVLITALEGTVEGMYVVISRIETVIDKVLEAVISGWKRLIVSKSG
jgi:hypothetical protein